MKKEIVKEQKDVNKVRKEWETHYNEYFYQTFYQSFNVDGIDGSLKDGEWTPPTDSAISLMVGTYPIISCF